MEPTYLSDQERTLIIRFTSDKAMFDAVRKAITYHINHQGVSEPGKPDSDKNWVFGLVNAMHTDEQIGALVRASAAGLGYLAQGFEGLLSIHAPEKPKDKKNPAL